MNEVTVNGITYPVHDAAKMFPMMTAIEFQELKDDIAKHGLREPIVFWQDMLVDGRNRLKACQELGIEVDTAELMEETDPWAYVISHNLHRRHLTTSHRTDVAERLADMKSGTRTDLGSKGLRSIEDAAKQMNVSPKSVKRRRKVRKEGCETLNDAITNGILPVTTAAEFVDAVPDKTKQSEIVAQGPEAIRKVVKKKKTDAKLGPVKVEPRKGTDGRTEGLNLSRFAMSYAELAVIQLRRIQPEDPGKVEALEYLLLHVIKMLDPNEKGVDPCLLMYRLSKDRVATLESIIRETTDDEVLQAIEREKQQIEPSRSEAQ